MKRFENLEGECLISEKPIHWKNYLSSLIFFTASFTMLIVRSFHMDRCLADLLVDTTKEPFDINAGTTMAWIEFLTFTATTIFFFTRLAKVACTRYYITNKRIIKTTGFFTIKISEMLIERCETVMIKQSIYERLFGCADILCLAPGSNLYLNDVPKAREFRKDIIQLISKQKK